ncbi:MAG: AlpA family phage regulatory protein [Paracoccaceae bacterium]
MRYLNMTQLREKLGDRSRSSIIRDYKSGRLPEPIKLGSRLYWVEADIDAAIAAHQAG